MLTEDFVRAQNYLIVTETPEDSQHLTTQRDFVSEIHPPPPRFKGLPRYLQTPPTAIITLKSKTRLRVSLYETNDVPWSRDKSSWAL